MTFVSSVFLLRLTHLKLTEGTSLSTKESSRELLYDNRTLLFVANDFETETKSESVAQKEKQFVR